MKIKMNTAIGWSLICAIALSALVVGIAAAEEPYQFVTSWEIRAPNDAQSGSPSGIVVDSAGTVFIGELNKNRIL